MAILGYEPTQQYNFCSKSLYRVLGVEDVDFYLELFQRLWKWIIMNSIFKLLLKLRSLIISGYSVEMLLAKLVQIFQYLQYFIKFWEFLLKHNGGWLDTIWKLIINKELLTVS